MNQPQMNRSDRRAMRKNLSRKPRLKMPAIIRPLLHEVHMVFSPIDTFLEQLSQNDVLCTRSLTPIFQDQEGKFYEATPAVKGFVSALQRIMSHHNIEIDLEPVLKLCAKLDALMPVSPELVSKCQALMLACRQHYRQMDLRVVKSIVNTELISLEFEQKGFKQA